MRVILFFDLPTESKENKRDYRLFRKFLIKSGFIMVQESVYSKLSPNTQSSNAIIDNVKRNKPNEGNVQILTITEKQYANIEMIVGEIKTEVLTTDKRLVII